MSDFVRDIQIVDAEGWTIHIVIETGVGFVQILAECERLGRRLVLKDAHIQGLRPGALGRQGLNAIAGKLKEIANVDTLEIHGAVRTTGAGRGRRPKPIVA